MSIYATWFTLEDPAAVAAELAAHGIGYATIGDDPDGELGAPYIYQGSHVVPAAGDLRGGHLSVAAIPNHVQACRAGDPEAERDDTRLAAHRAGYLRVDVAAAHTPGTPGQLVTLVLDTAQVRALRDTLTTWLDTDVIW